MINEIPDCVECLTQYLFTFRFNINLSCDNANEAIAFHFNPRPSEGTVVMNANFGGWGEEERDFEGDYPFGSDIYFDITIVCTEDKFHVSGNRYHVNRGDSKKQNKIHHQLNLGSFILVKMKKKENKISINGSFFNYIFSN
jgi:hypothetical protein